MKYIENTAEYEFVLNNSASHNLDLVIGRRLQKEVKYKLKVINREYGPQHRTIKYAIHNEYFSFPTTVFGIYLLTDDAGNSFHFYQFLLKDNGLRVILTENIYDGFVCLGEKTNGTFSSIGPPNLTMDEFVDEFWLTKFNKIYTVKKGIANLAIPLSQPAMVYFPVQDFIPQNITDEFIKI